jgi:hypothetical protein
MQRWEESKQWDWKQVSEGTEWGCTCHHGTVPKGFDESQSVGYSVENEELYQNNRHSSNYIKVR